MAQLAQQLPFTQNTLSLSPLLQKHTLLHRNTPTQVLCYKKATCFDCEWPENTVKKATYKNFDAAHRELAFQLTIEAPGVLEYYRAASVVYGNKIFIIDRAHRVLGIGILAVLALSWVLLLQTLCNQTNSVPVAFKDCITDGIVLSTKST